MTTYGLVDARYTVIQASRPLEYGNAVSVEESWDSLGLRRLLIQGAHRTCHIERLVWGWVVVTSNQPEEA